jgi:glycosyltransferase involved in cell wall biosynthesis
MTLTSPLIALVVATEWEPLHGGVSTFNRAFCAALVREAGWRVICVLPNPPTIQEEVSAAEVGVTLVRGDLIDHDDTNHRAQPPALPDGLVPELIFGHDFQTGSAALGLRDRFFDKAALVLFVHTAPDEIEWSKERTAQLPGGATRRHDERLQRRRDLCMAAELVLPIGPRLTKGIETDLWGDPSTPTIHEFLPGTANSELIPNNPPPVPRLIVFGRTEDLSLKGIDLAARAAAITQKTLHLKQLQLIVRGGAENEGDTLRKRLYEIAGSTSFEIVVRAYSPNLSTVERELRSAAVALMPSRVEGFGLSGLEAMALGLPTLISDQSGLAEYLDQTDEESARMVVVPTNRSQNDFEADAAGWAERLNAILRNQKGTRYSAECAAKRLREKLTWTGAIKGLLPKTEEAISTRKSKALQPEMA